MQSVYWLFWLNKHSCTPICISTFDLCSRTVCKIHLALYLNTCTTFWSCPWRQCCCVWACFYFPLLRSLVAFSQTAWDCKQRQNGGMDIFFLNCPVDWIHTGWDPIAMWARPLLGGLIMTADHANHDWILRALTRCVNMMLFCFHACLLCFSFFILFNPSYPVWSFY